MPQALRRTLRWSHDQYIYLALVIQNQADTKQIGREVLNICHYADYSVDRHSKNPVPPSKKVYFIALFIC